MRCREKKKILQQFQGLPGYTTKTATALEKACQEDLSFVGGLQMFKQLKE